MIETKESSVAILESANPAAMERLLRWFAAIEGPAFDLLPDRFNKMQKWLRQGSILWGVSRWTIGRLADDGSLKRSRVRGLVRFSAAIVAAYEKQM